MRHRLGTCKTKIKWISELINAPVNTFEAGKVKQVYIEITFHFFSD